MPVPTAADYEKMLLPAPARRRRHVPPPITMYDSVDLRQVPLRAQAVAGYVDGAWPTFHMLARVWPHARLLSIATSANHPANCLDVEAGDATVRQAPGWFYEQPHPHLPVFYASRDTMPALVRELELAGIVRRSYKLWVADFTGLEHIPAGYDGCQWTDRALGRNLDQSLLLPNFFTPFA